MPGSNAGHRMHGDGNVARRVGGTIGGTINGSDVSICTPCHGQGSGTVTMIGLILSKS